MKFFNRFLFAVTLGLVSLVSLRADPVRITNVEAQRLFYALRAIQPGVEPANIRVAALNLNSLRPYVEAYEAANQAFDVKTAKLQTDKSPDVLDKAVKISEDRKTLQNESVVKNGTIDLLPMSLSDDEIKNGKISPESYADIAHFLSGAQKK